VEKSNIGHHIRNLRGQPFAGFATRAAQVVEHSFISDRRSLASTCSKLQALVLDCANYLTLQLGNDSPLKSTYGASAVLVASVRRQHGAVRLRLILCPDFTARQLKQQLSALGLCPAVQELELANATVSGPGRQGSTPGSVCVILPVIVHTACCLCVMDCGMQGRGQWTQQASLQAVESFPNLQYLRLSRCAIPFSALKPLLEHSRSQGIYLSRSQLCNEGMHDIRWLLQLLSCEGPRYLNVDGKFHGGSSPLVPTKRPHLLSSLTHLVLDRPGIGDVQSWLDIIVHLPALEHFEASFKALTYSIPQVGRCLSAPLPLALCAGATAPCGSPLHPSSHVCDVQESRPPGPEMSILHMWCTQSCDGR
jgi:hypothetical protein